MRKRERKGEGGRKGERKGEGGRKREVRRLTSRVAMKKGVIQMNAHFNNSRHYTDDSALALNQ